MRFVVLASILLLGGCVEAVDLAEPVVQAPAYCPDGPNKVVACERQEALKAALRRS